MEAVYGSAKVVFWIFNIKKAAFADACTAKVRRMYGASTTKVRERYREESWKKGWRFFCGGTPGGYPKRFIFTQSKINVVKDAKSLRKEAKE